MMPTNKYLRIGYEPSAVIDRINQTNQSDGTPVSPTLTRRWVAADRVYDLYFHTNLKYAALANGRDVSNEYRLLRLRRQWQGKLVGSPPGPIAVSYERTSQIDGPGGFAMDSGRKSWFDCPGFKNVDRSPDSLRYLQEFIVGIGSLNKEFDLAPEFGGIYLIAAVDITPEKYKIWMSLEKSLTEDQIKGAMRVPGKPYPSQIIGSTPDFTSFRFVPTEWQDYTRYLS
jgi:hypothetical protein